MDNGQLARWVAQVEHMERMQAEKRDAQFWRDIRPDDVDMRSTVSSPIQRGGGVLSFLKKSLASFRTRPGNKQQSKLVRPKAGY